MGDEFAELFADPVGFDVDAFDLIIGPAALDGRPLDDVIGRGAERVAHVGLLEDFFAPGAGAAIGQKLCRGNTRAPGAVDGIYQSESDGIGHGDAEVEIPGAVRILNFAF